MKLMFGITEPLHLNIWLNTATIAEFLKINTSFVVVSLSIKSSIEQNAQKLKKVSAREPMKRKMFCGETDDEEILENVSLKKVFPKKNISSATSKRSDVVDPKQSGGEATEKEKFEACV